MSLAFIYYFVSQEQKKKRPDDAPNKIRFVMMGIGIGLVESSVAYVKERPEDMLLGAVAFSLWMAAMYSAFILNAIFNKKDVVK